MVVAISFTREFFGQNTYVIVCDNLESAFKQLATVNGFKDVIFIHYKMKAIFFGDDSADVIAEIKSIEVLR